LYGKIEGGDKPTRISKQDLELKERRVNELLRKINVKIAYRYDYTAIDMYDKNGKMLDSLIVGLTKPEAFTILDALENILRHELS
jgi:hypothetical protein